VCVNSVSTGFKNKKGIIVAVRLPQTKTGRVYPEIMDFSLKWGIELFNH
jgi:hypothetical protein